MSAVLADLACTANFVPSNLLSHAVKDCYSAKIKSAENLSKLSVRESLYTLKIHVYPLYYQLLIFLTLCT